MRYFLDKDFDAAMKRCVTFDAPLAGVDHAPQSMSLSSPHPFESAGGAGVTLLAPKLDEGRLAAAGLEAATFPDQPFALSS